MDRVYEEVKCSLQRNDPSMTTTECLYIYYALDDEYKNDLLDKLNELEGV